MKHLALFLGFIFPFFMTGQTVSFSDGTDLLSIGVVSDHAVGVSDMNGDGKDDIIRMSSNSSEQTIYAALQQAPGAMFNQIIVGTMDVPGTGSADAWAVFVADVDQNGRNDVISGGFYNGVYIFKSNADNTSYTTDIELLDEIYVQGSSAFDINNDGFVDLFICDDNDLSQILTNDGSGGFSEEVIGLVPVTDAPSDNSGNYGTTFMDVDNNGHADLYLSKCRQGVNNDADPRRINLLFMNNGDGTWTSEGEDRNVAIGAQSWCADFGDYDNDGDLDLFVGNHDAFSDFLVNDGTGNFEEMTDEAGLEGEFPFTVIQSTWADFDNDGFIDLLAMGNNSHVISMNNGDGTFTNYDDLFGSFPTNSYGLGDLNDDGFPDLYISANGYGGWGNEMWEDRAFLNDGNDNNYLKVNLTGVESNINGIGARISIYGPWGVQIREVKSGESYGIQNSLTQMFGIGIETTIDQVTVTWPSGSEDNFYDVASNQQFSIVEGSGVSSLSESEINLAEVSLYPNPAIETLNVSIGAYDNFVGQDLEFRIYDSNGKVVTINALNSAMEQLNIAGLSAGIYTYSITADGKIISVNEFVKH